MSYCGEHTAVKSKPNGFTAVSLRCRSWTCNDCQPRRKKQLIAQAIGGRPTTFLTLTTRRREGVTAEQAAKEISAAWRCLRLRIIRRYTNGKLPFIAVFEKHKSGWPHLHLLLRMPFIPQRWLSAQWQELTGSQVVWIEKIDRSHKAAVYCSKYCGKCVQKLGTAKRYWQSQDYDQRAPHEPKDRAAPGQGWEMWPRTLQAMAQGWTELGYSVVWQANHRCDVTRGPPW